ncbi:MAG: hypothetical protein BWZ10_01731 [candidate division BRC1 bacterium ADurb.BinA364]|nr:MAG: hypothetical protein BWZ10_01731 [candidate division BRC1 bacterium ADurb.BinA364]
MEERPEPKPEPEPEPEPEPAPAAEEIDEYDLQGNMPYPPGTIILLKDGRLGIVKEEIVGQPYDVVYVLLPDGKVDPQGIPLYPIESEKLGRLSKRELSYLEKRMYWERDRIVYFLDDVSLAPKVPHAKRDGDGGAPPAARPAAPAVVDDGYSLLRGRSLTIEHGSYNWDAVYWADDGKGAIVAHSQNGNWELIRLDLNRFNDKLKRGPLLSPEEVRKIESAIIEGMKKA